MLMLVNPTPKSSIDNFIPALTKSSRFLRHSGLSARKPRSCDFEFEMMGGKIMFGKDGNDPAGKIRLVQVGDGYIDGNIQVEAFWYRRAMLFKLYSRE
jgi:hypothetical protein